MPQHIAKKTYYRTADGRVVEEGDPDAAFLLVREGSAINDGELKRLGVKLGDLETGSHKEYDARADHAAKHANETDAEAAQRRDAMLSGVDDADGPAADGERGNLADADPVDGPDTGDAKAKAPAANKARASADNK